MNTEGTFQQLRFLQFNSPSDMVEAMIEHCRLPTTWRFIELADAMAAHLQVCVVVYETMNLTIHKDGQCSLQTAKFNRDAHLHVHIVRYSNSHYMAIVPCAVDKMPVLPTMYNCRAYEHYIQEVCLLAKKQHRLSCGQTTHLLCRTHIDEVDYWAK